MKQFSSSWKVKLFFFCYGVFYFFRKKKSSPLPEKINKILICNWANLGDVLLSTSIVPALKEKWPDAQISFLTSPHSQVVVKNHPLIDKSHTVSSWKGRVLFKPLIVQIGIFLHSLIFSDKALTQEINQENYDLAIDLHPFFPNCSYVLRKTNIIHFLEFSSAGFHNSRACAVDFPDKLGYLPKMYSFLLETLNISHKPLQPSFYFTNTNPLKDQDYIVLHVGTTEEKREWPIHHWKALAKHLSSEGKTLVFTGKGKREHDAIMEISSTLSHCINLCDNLDWDGFVSVIKEAHYVISVNTVSVHLAALFNTPGIGLYLSTKHPELWLPDYGSLYFLVEESPSIYFSDASFLKNHKNAKGLTHITPDDVTSCLKHLGHL